MQTKMNATMAVVTPSILRGRYRAERGLWRSTKHQIPNLKQAPMTEYSMTQTDRRARLGHCHLVLGACSGFGAWDLVLTSVHSGMNLPLRQRKRTSVAGQ